MGASLLVMWGAAVTTGVKLKYISDGPPALCYLECYVPYIAVDHELTYKISNDDNGRQYRTSYSVHSSLHNKRQCNHRVTGGISSPPSAILSFSEESAHPEISHLAGRLSDLAET